jgi:NAD(P)-dependent dehydrogenase (short-subunit alcohol dehydrogenase family)
LRDCAGEIRARGAELAIVGNGGPSFAAAFREDQRLEGPLLVDPELRAYRAAGLRRGRALALSPRLAFHAVRAFRGGFRQAGVQGDPWQLGGVFVIRPGGALAFRHVSREAGDHPPVEAVLAALAPGAPEVDEEAGLAPPLRFVARGLSRLVDPTVVLSFDRTGFALHSLAFDPDDLRVDLGSRRCLVTGASSGIGEATALGLADLGAEVVLLCRSRERGEAAAGRIRAATGSRRVSVEVLDVADLAAVRRLAPRLGGRPVDVLVHNAGVLPAERGETPDGLELALATHVAGPYLLTRLLEPALAAARGARVIFISSGGMYTRRLQVADPNWTRRRRYDGVVAYAETKRAQVVLAELLAERLRGAGVVVHSMHPGWADTPAVRSSLPGFHRATRAILRTPAEGADTVVWLAASERAGLSTGRFFFDRERRRTHWLPGTRETAADRERLLALCEEWTGGGARRESGSRT